MTSLRNVTPSESNIFESPVTINHRLNTALQRGVTLAQDLEDPKLDGTHAFLGILEDRGGLPAQVLQELGVLAEVEDRLRSIISSDDYRYGSSNKVLDSDGNPMGYMYKDGEGGAYIGDDEGKPVKG